METTTENPVGYAYPIIVAESPHMQSEVDALILEKKAMLQRRAEHEGRTIKEIRVSGSVMQPGLLDDGPDVPSYCGTVKAIWNPL